MATHNLKIGVVQMTSVDRPAENLEFMLSAIEAAGAQGAQLVIFPENSFYLRLDTQAEMVEFDPAGLGAKALADAARTENIHVLFTTPTLGHGGRSKNSTFYISPGGAPRAVYSKIHMFDVDVDGAPPVRESERFVSGERPEVLEIHGWRFGLSICYDLRFAELYSNYAGKVDAILVPSAFLMPTGKAHWHVLLRARAIENQCYVIAPAQGGEHKSHSGVIRHTYGHSLVVDPWGGVELDNDIGSGVKVVELDAGRIAKVRAQIPMHHHRRMLRSEK